MDCRYSANTFGFRRTDSIIRLPHVMLPHRLQQLRCIQFNIVIDCYGTCIDCYGMWDLPPGLPADWWEIPDDIRQWTAACEVLASLQHLRDAYITIFMMCQLERHRHPLDAELLCKLLEPLKAVRAFQTVMEVAMPLDTVRDRLALMPYQLLER